MHILHINDSLERGGAETLLVNTVQAIALLKPEISQTVVTLYDGGELKPEVENFAECFTLSFNLKNPFPAIIKLRNIIKAKQITVVHSHLLHSTFLARVALPSNVGLVSTYHSVFYEPSMVTYAKFEKYYDRFTYRSKYYSIFVSEAVRANITQVIGINKNQKVLLNFASPAFIDTYKLRPDKELRIIMVGNLHSIKNHEIAIKALAELKDLPITLDIYGDGELRVSLEKLIQSTGAHVTLKGKLKMSSAILAQYDLYAMTSHHEGMPISLLEAMQTGMPSLLNKVSMLEETAGDGALYYEYDSLNSLIEKLKYLYNNKEILKNISANALNKSKYYSASNYILSLFKIYKGYAYPLRQQFSVFY